MTKPPVPCGATCPHAELAYCHLIKGHAGEHYSVTTGTSWEDQ